MIPNICYFFFQNTIVSSFTNINKCVVYSQRNVYFFNFSIYWVRLPFTYRKFIAYREFIVHSFALLAPTSPPQPPRHIIECISLEHIITRKSNTNSYRTNRLSCVHRSHCASICAPFGFCVQSQVTKFRSTFWYVHSQLSLLLLSDR